MAISQLESKVTLKPDGEMLFDFAIKGNNPVQNQAVNFNYSHQENLFSLLESIRLINSVAKTIEQKINQDIEINCVFVIANYPRILFFCHLLDWCSTVPARHY